MTTGGVADAGPTRRRENNTASVVLRGLQGRRDQNTVVAHHPELVELRPASRRRLRAINSRRGALVCRPRSMAGCREVGWLTATQPLTKCEVKKKEKRWSARILTQLTFRQEVKLT